MSPVTRSALVIPSGYASQEVATFVAQLDDLLQRQHDQTRKLTLEDLAWQPAPGMNTIGMLMAHQAMIEVGWTGFGMEDLQRDQIRFQEILGIVDSGIPLPEGKRAARGPGRQGSGVLRRSADARARTSEARRRPRQGFGPDEHSAAHAPERRAARARGAMDDPVPGRALRPPLRPDPVAAARASGAGRGGEAVASDAAYGAVWAWRARRRQSAPRRALRRATQGIIDRVFWTTLVLRGSMSVAPWRAVAAIT